MRCLSHLFFFFLRKLFCCYKNIPALGSREYGSRDPPRWPLYTFYPQKLTLTSPTSGGRLVGIVLSRTKASELVIKIFLIVASVHGENRVRASFISDLNENWNSFSNLSVTFQRRVLLKANQWFSSCLRIKANCVEHFATCPVVTNKPSCRLDLFLSSVREELSLSFGLITES
jgi:hypothetical protein